MRLTVVSLIILIAKRRQHEKNRNRYRRTMRVNGRSCARYHKTCNRRSTPAVATPDTQNPAAPVAGENSFTEGQAKERIEAKGYAEVTGLTKGEDGIWSASATKDGKPTTVKLDFQGNITDAPK